MVQDIIPKERVLKNIRKGLVTPISNPESELDMDSEIYNKDRVKKEESIVRVFMEGENSYFHSCSNKFEFLLALNKLMEVKSWKEPVCFESSISKLLNQNGIPTQLNSPTLQSPLITTCTKAVSRPSGFNFDYRVQMFRKVLSAPILIIIATESQMTVYNEDKSNFTLTPLENYTTSFIRPEILNTKEIYLFLVKDNF